MGQKPRAEIICRCNNVSRETIQNAIRNGCRTLNQIFDETTAGVGPCGGSCRRKLKPLLEYYLQHGNFPEKITEDLTGKDPSYTTRALSPEEAADRTAEAAKKNPSGEGHS